MLEWQKKPVDYDTPTFAKVQGKKEEINYNDLNPFHDGVDRPSKL